MITKADKNIKGQSESTGEKWRIVDEAVIKGEANSITYTDQDIAEIPLEEITEEEPTIEQVRDVLKDKILASSLTEEEVNVLCAAFPDWQQDMDVITDQMLSYSQKLYRVIQVHRTQADWTPDVTPALFVSAYPENIIADWVQPTGAQDAYNIGDKVRFDSKIYESKINANVTVPDGDTPYNRYWKPIVGRL